MQQAVGTVSAQGHGSVVHGGEPSAGHHLGALEARFIHNWAALARGFGMDPLLGRVHALAFLADAPVCAVAVAGTLGIETTHAEARLDELLGWGVLQRHDDGRYSADTDPWSFFLSTLRERGRREFGPLLHSIREASAHAEILGKKGDELSPSQRERIAKMARFSQFVEQIAGLLETFASLGAGPVMSAMRMVAKMRGPRLLRI